MTASSALQESVADVFASIGRRRARSFVVSAPEADDIVAKRRRIIAQYDRPQFSASLRQKSAEAVKLTEACHQIGGQFLRLSDEISTISALSDADLLLSARVAFGAVRLEVVADLPFAAEVERLQNRMLAALLAAVRGPDPSGTVADVVRIASDGLSDVDSGIMTLEAANLVRQVRMWRRTFAALETVARFGLLCRGIFYAGLAETLGSKLEGKASLERIQEELVDVPIELVGFFPVVGEIAGKLKMAFDLVLAKLRKERVLTEDLEGMTDRLAWSEEFLELYSAALLKWAGLAIQTQQSIANLLLKTQASMTGQIDPSARAPQPATS